MFGEWNKVPKGGDDQFRLVARYFFYIVLGLGALVGVLYIWRFLEGLFDEDGQAERATETVSDTFQWLGSQLFLWIPVVIIFAVIIIAGIIGARWLTKSHYRKRAEEQVRYLRILPSNDIELDLDKVDELTRTFGGMVRTVRTRLRYGRPWFRLRFALPEGSKEIGIYLAYPGDKENSVKDTLRSVYPTVELHDISAEQFPGPKKGGSGGHFIFKIGQNKGLPLASLKQKKQSHLGSVLNCLRPGTYLDLQFSPVSWKELEERTEEAVDDLKRKKTKDMDPEERSRRVSLVQRFTGRELSFHVRLSIWSNSANAVSVVRSTAESIETAMKYDGAIQFIRHDWWNPLMDSNLVPIPYPWTILTWTCDEIANLLHIPPASHYIYQEAKEDGPDTRGFIVHLENNQRSLKPDEWNEGVLIGKIHHPLEKREVRVHFEQLSKHFILTGASGMGKSSLAVEMIQSLLDEWFENPDEAPGFTIIDPAREIIPIIENRLRIAERVGVNIPKEKIHHFNLTHDATHVPALNLLHKVEGVSTNQLAEQLAMVLVTFEEEDEPLSRSKRLMTTAIQSLLEDEETHTILGIDDIFRNVSFRNRVIRNVKDPYVRRFWANVDEEEMKREADRVLHRIDRLLQSPTMRRLFCQKEMNLDIAKYMDEGHLVMFDTYNLKDYDIRVTVGQLINQYYQVARKRSSGAKFHLMMLDEAHLVQIPLLTEILQEDRKYPFGLGLITREIDHFNNDALMQAIRSNIGMVLSCGQTEGSDEVESITRQNIKSSFLEKLQERHAAVYIRSKRRQRSDVTTCVVQNDPPVVYRPDGKVADHRSEEKDEALLWGLEWGLEIMKNSPEVRPIEEVEREIAEYMDQSLFFDKRSESAN